VISQAVLAVSLMATYDMAVFFLERLMKVLFENFEVLDGDHQTALDGLTFYLLSTTIFSSFPSSSTHSETS
jgi:hypothetical protein